MPKMDVNEVLMDPDLSDTFSVRRRAESVNEKGRTEVVPEMHEGLIGVVTPMDPAKLDRRDDGQIAERAIRVSTPFALRGASFGFQPDVIVYDGTEYLVVKVKSLRRFGAGFYKAEAASFRITDNPQ